jgi:hypothetical protein
VSESTKDTQWGTTRKRLWGYGNLYTPSAGPMIIHLQRERGLQHRTIVLSTQQLKWLRVGVLLLALVITIGAASWIYLATQAARVPFLTRRVTHLQHDARRVDTLQLKLTELERRYEQVEQMLGASKPQSAAQTGSATSGAVASGDSTRATETPSTHQ